MLITTSTLTICQQVAAAEAQVASTKPGTDFHYTWRSGVLPSSSGSANESDSPSATRLKSAVSEFDVAPLTVINAMDEALLRSPRAAAIRSTLGITQANYAYATVQRNSYFFFDRGLVAEAVRRIGPAMTWTPPWQTAFDFLVAKRQVDQSKLEILRDLWQLRSDTRRAYTDLVIAQETSKATANLVYLGQQTYTVAQRRFAAGAVPEFDVIKGKVILEQAELDQKLADQRVIKARQYLNLLLGRPPKQAIAVVNFAPSAPNTSRGRSYLLPDFEESLPDIDAFLTQARTYRWELMIVAQQMKVNRANLENAYATILPVPQLVLGGSTSGNQPTGPKLNATFFTVNAELPITNMQQGDIAKYRATTKQLNWQLGAVKNQVNIEVSAAYNDLLTYRERIKLYQNSLLADSEEAARLARRSYEVGHSDITGLIQAQQSNFQTQLQYLADVQSYQQAFVDLEKSVGRPLQ